MRSGLVEASGIFEEMTVAALQLPCKGAALLQ